MKKSKKNTAIPTMAPIRWAASAPLLPPLRHLTRSIVQSLSGWNDATQDPRITWLKNEDAPSSAAGFIAAGGRAFETIGRLRVVGCEATWLEKKAILKPNPLRQQILISPAADLKRFPGRSEWKSVRLVPLCRGGSMDCCTVCSKC